MSKSLQHFVTQCNIISMKLVLLIMLQDSEGLWKQNEVSLNKMLPSSKETTLLCFFFVNQRHGLKMHFKSSNQNTQNVVHSPSLMS